MDLATYSAENHTTDWPGGLTTTTLFAEDLPATKQFYRDAFQLPVVLADDNSAVFKFRETLIKPPLRCVRSGTDPSCARRRPQWTTIRVHALCRAGAATEGVMDNLIGRTRFR